MAKKGKGKKGYKKHYRKAKKVVSKARQKTMRLVKGVALAGPTIAFIAEGQSNLKGSPLTDKLFDGAQRLAMATTGVVYRKGGDVTFEPKWLLIGWGPVVVYKGIQYGANVIPGKKDSPIAELGHVLGG